MHMPQFDAKARAHSHMLPLVKSDTTVGGDDLCYLLLTDHLPTANKE